MKMTKEEALQKIEELKQFVQQETEEVKKNVITRFPGESDVNLNINGEWVADIYHAEEQGGYYRGRRVSGHFASMYLAESGGTWFTEGGEKIDGYLYFKPNN